MKKLKSGYKDRSARNAEIDGITFQVKPMSSEIMTTFAMYTNGMRDKLLSLGEKKEFIKTHIVGWSEMYFEDGEEVEYTDELAMEYLTHEDYDELFMTLYWKSIELASEKEVEVEKAKKAAKK